jgi:hypothetical protein
MVGNSSKILQKTLEESFKKGVIQSEFDNLKEGDFISVGGSDRYGIVMKKLENFQLAVQYLNHYGGDIIETIISVENIRVLTQNERIAFCNELFTRKYVICDNQIMTEIQRDFYIEDKRMREMEQPKTYALFPPLEQINAGEIMTMMTKDNKKIVFVYNKVGKDNKIYCESCLFLEINKLYLNTSDKPICPVDNVLWVTYASDLDKLLLTNSIKSANENELVSKDLTSLLCKPKSILFVHDWLNNDDYILKYQKVYGGRLIYSSCVSFNNSKVESMNYEADNSIEMCNIDVIRYANGEEQKIFNNFYADAEIELVPFRTKVLVSNGKGTLWIPGVYGFETYERNERRYVIVGGQSYKFLKPWKNNKNLLGMKYEDTVKS